MELKQVLDQLGVDTIIEDMARRIHKLEKPLAIVAVLKGGAYTAYRLLQLLNDTYTPDSWPSDVVIGHIGLESYGDGMKSRGEVKLMTPLDLSRNEICGRIVIIVDDCIETGNTLEEAKKIISGYGPSSMYTAVLVDKAALRIRTPSPKPDICGWSYLGDGFLVGCGMGAGEKYRGLPEVCEVIKEGV